MERHSQADLLKILSQFQNNLMQKKTYTKGIQCDQSWVTITIPTSELGQHIINLMCGNAADGILRRYDTTA